MERIVQLREGEYNALYDTANLNDEEIQKKAEELWEKKCVPELLVKIDFGRGDNYLAKINCRSIMFSPSEKFKIPSKVRNAFANIVDRYILHDIDVTFGGAMEAVKRYNKKERIMNNILRVCLIVAATGWMAFACLLFGFVMK